MVAIQRVSATGVIQVPPVGREHVVGFIVDPAEGNHGAVEASFASVVEDDIEDHLDAGDVEITD
jgi:hypothetical protein